jgi:hypothetical protein
MNAITIYLASEFGAEVIEGSISGSIGSFAPTPYARNASLRYSLAFTAIMYLIAYAIYAR